MERLQGDELLYKGTTILPSDQGVRLINILAISCPSAPLGTENFEGKEEASTSPVARGLRRGAKKPTVGRRCDPR